jgi:predicted ATPase
MAHASMIKGKINESTDYIAEAFRISGRDTDRHYDAELYRLQGELVLAGRSGTNGQRAKENAEAHFRRAIKIAHLHRSKSLELRATTSLCRLWQKQGKVKEATQKLRKICGRFTEGFDTPDLKTAKMLLDELS